MGNIPSQSQNTYKSGGQKVGDKSAYTNPII